MLGLKNKKKQEKRPKWIVYNYGDEVFEFAECSGCGYEVEKYMGLMFCPKCQKMMDGSILAEEVEKAERD